jgi:hypothetical protein
MSCSASFHPWKSCHVPATHVTPQPLWRGLVVVVVVSAYVTPPQHEGDWHRSGIASSSTRVVTPPMRWTGLCSTPTIALYCPWQQPVQTCRSPRLGMAACLQFQGLPLLAPHLAWFQGPRVQFIDLEVVGLLSTSCHRTLQFTIMLDVLV